MQAIVERSSLESPDSSVSRAAGFAHFTTGFDAKSTRGVILDCQAGLKIVSSAPFVESLPYTPTRTRILIISLSVFLLKATAIGGQDIDITMVASTLDRCQEALESNCLDDIDFASQYAHLIRKYAAQLEASSHTNHIRPVNGKTSQTAQMPQAELANIGEDSETNIYSGISASQGFTGTDGDISMTNDIPLWAMDPNMNLLDSGWDSVAFGFEADSLDFLWGHHEQDLQFPQEDLTGL